MMQRVVPPTTEAGAGTARVRDGETLFGAPYDLRRVPGQPSQVYFRYFQQLTSLIEHASSITKNKKYIKHFLLVSPLPASAGFVLPVMGFVSGSGLLDVPTATPMSLRPMWRTFESALFGFPSPAVFTNTKPVVVTQKRNYTARERDMEDLLADVGAGDAVEPFRRRRRQLPSRSAAPPMPVVVPVTCVNGVGTNTPEQMVYWDGDFDAAPEVVYGDGDGTINLASMLAFDEEMSRRPEHHQYKTIKLRGASHGSLLAAEWSLKRVIQEILEASNRV
ncbi:hypothetical protein PR202_gb26472 [Eleusine coracana subsp. coracana]|uniref:Uncharacterized protein n=1 Tax=Eleusine coracana subsp. coracana TaxID=191504 RepID=A0AAV5FRL0_ELECO|nr:hypothetical protein PR202_gb26472 [Eleusine coracana subsp. coracana]